MRRIEDVEVGLSLVAAGYTPTEASRSSGIPRSTIRYWIDHGRSLRRSVGLPLAPCGCGMIESAATPEKYAYLLGLYLGDGHLSRLDRSWRLRITMDARYSEIIAECCTAISALTGRPAGVYPRRRAQCVDISSYWNHWICLFPQHGEGRKHERTIRLERWQNQIVASHPKPFIRGLIHSDGCRIVALERKGANVRHAVRYLFSNRSNDIHDLFLWACAVVGVRCTWPSFKQAAVYRKQSVELLVAFIGPKR